MARTTQTPAKKRPTLEERRAAFGEALRAAMANAGVTQDDFAAELGKAQAAVSAWVTGRSAPDDPMDVFDIERALKLAPGSLSRFLGYLPIDAVVVTANFDAVLDADPFLDADSRQAISLVYEQLKGARRRSARPGRPRKA